MNLTDRPTPETNANLWVSIAGCIRVCEPIKNCYVPASVARQGFSNEELISARATLAATEPKA